MSSPLLEALEIGRSSPNGSWLLRHVSLCLRAGDRWAVRGATGSGKTLLLRALALLDSIDEGQILWQGSEVDDDDVPAYRQNVVYLHQMPVLTEGSVESNLSLPLNFRQQPADVAPLERSVGLLELLGRDRAFLRKPSRDLSGGESQIVALLRAMRLNPTILLLDEPTAALDVQATKSIETLIGCWLQDSVGERATVWVSHDDEQIERIADKILTLRGGRIEE